MCSAQAANLVVTYLDVFISSSISSRISTSMLTPANRITSSFWSLLPFQQFIVFYLEAVILVWLSGAGVTLTNETFHHPNIFAMYLFGCRNRSCIDSFSVGRLIPASYHSHKMSILFGSETFPYESYMVEMFWFSAPGQGVLVFETTKVSCRTGLAADWEVFHPPDAIESWIIGETYGV